MESQTSQDTPKLINPFESLPDCLLVTLLSYLDATSLYIMSKTCGKFKNLLKDGCFWKYIDARKKPNTSDKIEYCRNNVNKKTTHLLLKGMNSTDSIFGKEHFNSLKVATNLTVMVLENQFFDATKITMNDFPTTLIELSLKGCHVSNSDHFFQKSLEAMVNLKVFLLDECDWVEVSSVMSLARYKKLEILSFFKCRGLCDSIPYLSLAGTYGFKNLKILDARLTGMGNELLRCMSRSKSLLALYLQHEDISYKLDYYKRRLTMINDKEPMEDFEGDPPEMLVSDRKYYHTSTLVNNRGLIDYYRYHSTNTDEPFPDSQLYFMPFKQCCCEYFYKRREEKAILRGRLPPERGQLSEFERYKNYVCFPNLDVEQFNQSVLGNPDDSHKRRDIYRDNPMVSNPREVGHWNTDAMWIGSGDQESKEEKVEEDADEDVDLRGYRWPGTRKGWWEKGLKHTYWDVAESRSDMSKPVGLREFDARYDFDTNSRAHVSNVYIVTVRNQLRRANENLDEEIIRDFDNTVRQYQERVNAPRNEEDVSPERNRPNQETINVDICVEGRPAGGGDLLEVDAEEIVGDFDNNAGQIQDRDNGLRNEEHAIPERNRPIQERNNADASIEGRDHQNRVRNEGEASGDRRDPLNENREDGSRNNGDDDDDRPSNDGGGGAERIVRPRRGITGVIVGQFHYQPDARRNQRNPSNEGGEPVDPNQPSTSGMHISIKRKFLLDPNNPSKRLKISIKSDGTPTLLSVMPRQQEGASDSFDIQPIDLSNNSSRNIAEGQRGNDDTNSTSNPTINITVRNVHNDTQSVTNAEQNSNNNGQSLNNNRQNLNNNVQNLNNDMQNTVKMIHEYVQNLSSHELDFHNYAQNRDGDVQSTSNETSVSRTQKLNAPTMSSKASASGTRAQNTNDNVQSISNEAGGSSSRARNLNEDMQTPSNKASGSGIRSNKAEDLSEAGNSNQGRISNEERDLNEAGPSGSNQRRGEENPENRPHINLSLENEERVSNFQFSYRSHNNSHQGANMHMIDLQEVPPERVEVFPSERLRIFEPNQNLNDLAGLMPNNLDFVRIPFGRSNQAKIPLKHISLRGYREIDDEALEYIKHLNLELLDVTHTRVTERGVEKFLTYQPNCRVVHESHCICLPRLNF